MSTETAKAEAPRTTLPTVTVKPKRNTEAPPMKAVAWWGKHDMRVVEKMRPTVTDPEDVVLRVTSSCISGSDLHLYDGSVGGLKKGDVLGHEFMGVVEEVGPAVSNVNVGDRVVVSGNIACGQCSYCQQGLFNVCDATNCSAQQAMYGHCTAGVFGYGDMMGGYEGGQAEYVRVPFANTNCLRFDQSLPDERVILLSDILPTAWHANEMGEVGPGKNVAIWGAGPGGILAAQCALQRGAARVVLIDKVPDRLELASSKINGIETIDFSKTKVDEALRTMFPEFHGPDVCIEAVGFHYGESALHKVEQKLGLETDSAEVLNQLIRCARKGGCISVIGLHTGRVNHFNIGGFMEKGLTMRASTTPVQRYWPTLVKKIEVGELDPTIVITHTQPLEQAAHAYKIVNDKKYGCLKVILKARGATLEPSPA